MKNRLLSGGAAIAMFIALGTGAQSADPVIADPMTDWSGFYLGAHAGYGWASMDGCHDCDDGSALFANDLDLEDIVYGVHGGYNWQWDNLVLGIEADVSLTDMDDSEPSPSSTEAHSAELDMLASVRARLGIALDDVLLYATAGIAIPDAEWEATGLPGEDDRKFGEIGGVAGGGIEFAMTDSIRLRAEGLYYFFNESEDVDDVAGGQSGEEIELEDVIVVRGGVSFYF